MQPHDAHPGQMPPPPGAQQQVQVNISTQPLGEPEIAALNQLAKNPDEWVALQMDVPNYAPVGVQADGAIIWQATFVTPPGFFKFQGSRLVDQNGAPAGIHEMLNNTFLRAVFPFIRMLVKRAGLGENVAVPPVERPSLEDLLAQTPAPPEEAPDDDRPAE